MKKHLIAIVALLAIGGFAQAETSTTDVKAPKAPKKSSVKGRKKKSETVEASPAESAPTKLDSAGLTASRRPSAYERSTADLLDLVVLPQTNHFVGSASVNVQKQKYTFTRNGKDVSETVDTPQIVTTELAYGAVPKLSVFGRLRASPETKSEINSPGTESRTSRRSGLYDPTVGATYKVADQDIQKVNAYITGELTPSVFDAKDPEDKAEGTVATGGNIVYVRGKITREYGLFGLGGFIAYNYLDKRKLSSAKTNSKSEITGGSEATIGVDGIYRATPQLGVGGSLRYATVSAFDRVDISQDNAKSSVDGYNYIEFALNGRYEILPSQLAAFATYTQIVGSPTSKFKGGGQTVDVALSDNTFSLGAQFLF